MVSHEGWRGVWPVMKSGEKYGKSERVERSMVSQEGWMDYGQSGRVERRRVGQGEWGEVGGGRMSGKENGL